MSDGYVGFGAILKVGDVTNTTSMTNVANITRIQGASSRRGVIDISTMDSTAAYSEFKPSLADVGEMTFDLNYEGSTATAKALWLRNLMTSTAKIWTLVVNDYATASQRSSIVCWGTVTGADQGTPHDGKVEQTVTIKFTGVPTHTGYGSEA